jgi:hypothetical protein
MLFWSEVSELHAQVSGFLIPFAPHRISQLAETADDPWRLRKRDSEREWASGGEVQ